MPDPFLEAGQTWYGHGISRTLLEVERNAEGHVVALIYEDETVPDQGPQSCLKDEFLQWLRVNDAFITGT